MSGEYRLDGAHIGDDGPVGVKHSEGKPRYSLLPPEVEGWVRMALWKVKFSGPELPSAMLPDLEGKLNLDTCLRGLVDRWGSVESFIEGVVSVLTHGAGKYSDDNWQHVDDQEYYNAYRRHLNAGWFVMDGQWLDESGHHHLLHAGACVVILKGKEMMRDD